MNIPVRVAVSGVAVNAAAESGVISVPAAAAVKFEIGGEAYAGSYEFTPIDEAQTISCEDRLMMQDITIHPIPSNYGKVSWDGAKITIE